MQIIQRYRLLMPCSPANASRARQSFAVGTFRLTRRRTSRVETDSCGVAPADSLGTCRASCRGDLVPAAPLSSPASHNTTVWIQLASTTSLRGEKTPLHHTRHCRQLCRHYVAHRISSLARQRYFWKTFKIIFATILTGCF